MPIPGSPGWSIVYDAPPGPALGWAQLGSDPTAPRSPSNVYDFVFPEGMVEGTAPSTIYYPQLQRHHVAPGVLLDIDATEVYVGFWWKPSSPFDLGPNGNKIAFLFNGGGATGQQFLILLPTDGSTCCRSIPATSVAPPERQCHRRHAWRLAPDRVVRAALDRHAQVVARRRLQGHHTDVRNTVKFDIFKFSPTWGGNIGARKRQTDHYWFDHVHVSIR